jgi:hypothetical protein
VRLSFPLLARWVLFAGAVAGAAYSLMLARAEWLFRQDTAVSVPAAVSLVPFQSSYLARLAAWLPSQRVALLQRAVAINPFDSESWTQLGFAAEFQQHDPTAAERHYLRAAEVNRMFLPRWTLTNFYFRHGRTDEFYRWAAASLANTPYAPEPIFAQMWSMGQDAQRNARTVPDRPRILLAYAWYLSNQDQVATLPSVVARLIAAAGHRDPRAWGRDSLLAEIEDRLITRGNRTAALEIWSTLSKAGWIRLTVPTMQAPVTNGDFNVPLYRHGFDWRPVPIEGVRMDESSLNGTLRIELSGNQPEQCVLLRQYLPLEPGRSYQFAWLAQTQLSEQPAGVRWHLRRLSDGSELQPASADLSAGSGIWNVQAAEPLEVLSLEFARPLGHLRARGVVVLKTVAAQLH